MELESGIPTFLEEIVEDVSSHLNKTVRVTGTIHSYDPNSDIVALVDGQHMLLIDTRLLGVLQYHLGQAYQLIGQLVEPEALGENNELVHDGVEEDVRYSSRVILKAKVARQVDGLDMAVYRKAVTELRDFLK